MLVVFVILGIGADDCFVFTDAWKQSAPLAGARPPEGESQEKYRHKRLNYAFVRALQSMMNTSLTTAVAFLATALSPIMPIHAFGIYAAICVLMNYALAMTMLPAVIIWHDELCRGGCRSRRREENKAPEDVAAAPPRPEVNRPVEAYLRALNYRANRKPLARGLVVVLGAVAAFMAWSAARLEPPKEQEPWFFNKHMFQQVVNLANSESYGTNEDRSYESFHVVFGIDGAKRKGFDPYAPAKRRAAARYAQGFDLSSKASQDAFLEACDLVEDWPCGPPGCKGNRLIRPNTTLCFLREFRTWHANSYPEDADALSKTNFDDRLKVFRATTTPENFVLYSSWADVIGVVGGELKYARIDARLTMNRAASDEHRKHALRRSNKLLTSIRRRAQGTGLRGIFHISPAWIWFKTQMALVTGLLMGIIVGFPFAFLVLTLATQNVLLSLYAIVNIGCIVSGVLGLCYWLGWSLGMRESVAGVVVIGLAVDYTIHIGHMYDHGRTHANLERREARTAYALRKMGGTVFAGAATTAGSASLMLACQLTFFVQMAILIVFTVVLSILMALFFYVPLLFAYGPQHDQGNICGLARFCEGAGTAPPDAKARVVDEESKSNSA